MPGVGGIMDSEISKVTITTNHKEITVHRRNPKRPPGSGDFFVTIRELDNPRATTTYLEERDVKRIEGLLDALKFATRRL
jgi:hypothetical protein